MALAEVKPNLKMEIKDNKLRIEVDLTVEGSLSKTELNYTLASSGGNMVIDPQHVLVLTVYRKRSDLTTKERKALRKRKEEGTER